MPGYTVMLAPNKHLIILLSSAQQSSLKKSHLTPSKLIAVFYFLVLHVSHYVTHSDGDQGI